MKIGKLLKMNLGTYRTKKEKNEMTQLKKIKNKTLLQHSGWHRILKQEVLFGNLTSASQLKDLDDLSKSSVLQVSLTRKMVQWLSISHMDCRLKCVNINIYKVLWICLALKSASEINHQTCLVQYGVRESDKTASHDYNDSTFFLVFCCGIYFWSHQLPYTN